ncbi:MAG: Eco57I restriction-modification methylase domain-containing protein [Paludibacter sp.]|nr:Eco57I restriction-modification methylase domain-containing protein [Paludibacter sp.]
MDKKTAQLLIEDTFNNAFNEEQFTVFAKNLLNDLEPKNNFYTGNLIWDDYKEHINTYKRIGKYVDPEGEALDVLIVEVKSLTKLERARTTLRNFVIKHLGKFEKDYALVAFYSKEDDGADWRFSFIKLEYRSELDEEKGKVKLKKEFNPAKRYSFLVGKYEKAHTAKNQLLPLLQNIANNPTIEELEAAFSIEKVTDEFFSQYKDLYIKLFEHFENDSYVKAAINQAKIDNSRFTKKLLGQIVFLYFLQKKGWLGVAQNERWGTGKKRFVQELFDQAKAEGVNFFKDKLQYLFYEALAKERDNVNSYYERFKCRIPFLNGGLFEADYRWENANITIPENLFRNEEKNKAGDVGTGVLDVFDRYNFTIKEDEPLDKEVAVDPEMLGKVFENMLDITERKSKGAFYTPREIVHYMCQESLIQYLDNALEGNVVKEDIETFIRKGHFALENDERVATKGETKTYKYQLPESIRQNANLIDQKLIDIRICDPAIGSGAFPVGLLHELVNAMLVLKPHLSYDYLTEKLKGFGFEHRESVSDSRYIYRLKRHIIQESIYGVDIDASAIDIARLRLWLSLVVDEDDLDPIETLPNLDYKIVCGNSLIGLPDSAMKDLTVEAELETLKEKFYNLKDDAQKKALRQQINEKMRELLNSVEQFASYKIDFDFKLFFSEVWYKKKSQDDPKPERNGFDVLIGNPPYVRQELFKEYKYYLQSSYKSIYDGRADLYTYFIKKGFDILCNNGVLTLITSNKFIVRGYGEKIRKVLAREKTIKTIVNFGELPVFKASVDSLIIVAKNRKPTPESCLIYAQATEEEHITDIYKFLALNHVSKKLLSLDESWVFKDKKSMRILDRLNNFKQKLGDLFEIFGGIKTGCDKAFIIDSSVRLNLLESDPNSEKLIKPWYRGRDIHKWSASPELFIIYIPQNEINIDDYPAIKNHLSGYQEELEKRATNQKWFELQQPQRRFTKLFESEKIIYSEIALEMRALLDKGKAYGTMKMFFIPYNSIVLAILNSSLFDWYARMNFSSLGDPWNGGRLEFKTLYMSKVPIPNINKKESVCFEIIIKYVTLLKKIERDLELKFYEHLLDGLIYELYFPEEIKSAGKEILKHLGNLNPINDEMSEEEKLAIIQSEFERLYDPNHPVRFAIETLDSVEEVRIIKEALK